MAQAARSYSSYYNSYSKNTARSNAAPSSRRSVARIADIPSGFQVPVRGTRNAVSTGKAAISPEAQRLAAISPFAITAFKVALTLILTIALFASVRMVFWFQALDATSAIATLEVSIQEAQAAGSDLEVEHSVLSNPTTIQAQAKALGMSSASSVTSITIELYSDPVLNADGSICMHDTLAKLKGAHSVASN